MGAVGLSGTAQARRNGARSVEHQQVGPRPMAAVEDTGISVRATIALLHDLGHLYVALNSLNTPTT